MLDSWTHAIIWDCRRAKLLVFVVTSNKLVVQAPDLMSGYGGGKAWKAHSIQNPVRVALRLPAKHSQVPLFQSPHGAADLPP